MSIRQWACINPATATTGKRTSRPGHLGGIYRHLLPNAATLATWPVAKLAQGDDGLDISPAVRQVVESFSIFMTRTPKYCPRDFGWMTQPPLSKLLGHIRSYSLPRIDPEAQSPKSRKTSESPKITVPLYPFLQAFR